GGGNAGRDEGVGLIVDEVKSFRRGIGVAEVRSHHAGAERAGAAQRGNRCKPHQSASTTVAAGTVLGRRRENRPIAAGSTVRKRQGAASVPPTTTTASGRCTWLPMAVEKAAGSRPTQAAVPVISTGRICTPPGS